MKESNLVDDIRVGGYIFEVEFCQDSGCVTLKSFVNDQYKTEVSSQDFFYPEGANNLMELGNFLVRIGEK